MKLTDLSQQAKKLAIRRTQFFRHIVVEVIVPSLYNAAQAFFLPDCDRFQRRISIPMK